MKEQKPRNGADTFFKYLLIGFVVSSFKLNVQGLSRIAILQEMFMAFTVNFITSIPFALAWMFSEAIFIHFKKKYKK